MSEQVEWRVIKDVTGVWHNASDGAQSMFGLTSAKKLAQKLGPPWQVRHRTTMLSPDEHQAALDQCCAQSQSYGSPWAP